MGTGGCVMTVGGSDEGAGRGGQRRRKEGEEMRDEREYDCCGAVCFFG